MVLGGTIIPLPDNQVLNGITSSGANTTFTVQESGEYELSYDIHLSNSFLVSSRIKVNGNGNNGSVYTPSTSTKHLSGTTTVTLTAGDTLNLELYGLIGALTLDSDEPTTLRIKKIN